jgi:CRP/FNR family cyclic AMP-dependent transcriptional regulator
LNAECPNIGEDLKKCELFAPLDKRDVERLAASLAESCRTDEYQAGDTIFVQGEHCTRLLVIAEGQVLIQRAVQMGDRTARSSIALVGRGRALGWTALLYGPHDATASAICQKPTRVVSLDGAELLSALRQEPGIGFVVMERLASMLGDRLRSAYTAMQVLP